MEVRLDGYIHITDVVDMNGKSMSESEKESIREELNNQTLCMGLASKTISDFETLEEKYTFEFEIIDMEQYKFESYE